MRFRVFLPVVQVLAVVGVFAGTKLCHDPRLLAEYVYPARSLLVKENFPLVVAWAPFAYVVDWCSRFLSPMTGIWFVVGVAVVGLLLLSSVALFWYLVLIEIEARIHGESKVRFRSTVGELLTVVTLSLTGVGAILYAYIDGESLLRLRRSKVDSILGGLLLLAWGAVLIGISIQDLRWVLRMHAAQKPAHSAETKT